jgi:hypothetical protein
MKLIVSFLILLLLFSGAASPVYAKLRINEFSSATTNDWIEIYNDSNDDIPLSDYRLRDSSATNKLDLSGILAPRGFIVFDWGDNLNKTGDSIKIVRSVNESEEEDKVIYGNLEGKVIEAPESGQYAARKTDGGSTWGLFFSETRGGMNTNTNPVPTPTPTPTSTPEPSATPTRTPTPTKSPTQTVSTKAPSDEATAVQGASVRVSPTIDYNVPTPVLAARDERELPTIIPTKKDTETRVLGTSGVNPAIIMVFIGVIVLLTSGGYGYYLYRKNQ